MGRLGAARALSRETSLEFLRPAIGPTHLAVALGREAIKIGYSVLSTPATTLLTTLARVLTIRGDSYLREKRRSGLIKGMALNQQQEA